ncbi:MAG: ribonuclease Z, partial [Ginsengibacter sp.]
YSPEKLKEIIQIQLDAANATLTFDCHFHYLKEEGQIWEDEKTSVECFKVNHRIECWGFLFKEKRNPRTILPSAVHQYQVPTSFYENLQQGENFIDENGKEIINEILTMPGKREKSYAFCADTAYYEPICKYIFEADLVYHEATYLDELQTRAHSRYHSTSKQAALIAKKACVSKLIIGHFSSMYETLEKFKEEACEIFENSEIAEEGVSYLV